MEKKYQVVWSYKATHDLRRIYKYVAISRKQPLNAERLTNGIWNYSLKLELNLGSYKVLIKFQLRKKYSEVSITRKPIE